MTEAPVDFYHAPNTRSSGVFFLLEELGAPYSLHALNMKAGEQRHPDFLAINPMGKVPAIVHRGELVTEQVAIHIYLADTFPASGLAPALSDRMRGPYLRFLAFYGSSFEPAVIDRALKREPGSAAMSPYGDFDTTLGTITARLRAAPYLLGESISAADLLWGTALSWMTRFKLVPESPEILAFVERITSRPAYARMQAQDEKLAASQ